MSLKDKIKSNRSKRAIEAVPTPEWADADGETHVRGLSAKERDSWEADIVRDPKKRDLSNIRAKFVVLCSCDKAGELAFKPEDAGWLGEENAGVIDRLWDAGRKLSGITDEDDEELVKNCEETTDDALPTS